jgi:DNA-directed RNA polymerase
METTLRRPINELSATYGDEMLAAEIALEERMVSIGRDQIRKQIEAARQRGNESGTGYGKTLVAMSIDKLAEAITGFITQGKAKAGRRHVAIKYLEQVEPDVAGFIAMRVVVDSLTGKKQLMQRVCVNIGKRIEDEVRFAQFKENEGKMYDRALDRAGKATAYHRRKATMAGYDRRFNETEWNAWPEDDCLQVGSALVNMITQTGLIEVADEVNTRRDTVKVLQPTTKLVEWIEKEVARTELLSPAYMPMIVKPLDWTDPYNGGYLTQDAQSRNNMVKTGNRNYLTELADHAEDMPMVYQSINALQSTRWRINPRVRETLVELWERGQDVAKLPARDDTAYVACPCCSAPIDLPKLNTRGSTDHDCFEDEDVLREWKQRAYAAHAGNVSLRSKRLSLAKTIKVADMLAEAEAIYFPYQLDFRGRVYAIPSFNPQGNDVTKGLLEFADAKPIEDGVGAGWLAIHGSNVFGYDKASLEDRIGWVEDHEQEIIMCANDPFGCRFWHDADKPWQFLAFCFEWAEFVEQGYGYMSRIAVALDGSCSGIQHFSAMLLDSVGGRAVNLLPAETPEDIYQRVCDKVMDKLKLAAGELGTTIAKAISEETNNSSLKNHSSAVAIAELAEAKGLSDEEVYALGWLSLQPSRKTTKRQVMTLPYGSTQYSCREYTEEWLRDQLSSGFTMPWTKDKTFKATQYMSALIWDAIGEVVIAARAAMDWLQKCAKVVAAEQLPVYWTTPTGFRVMQQYKNHKSRRVKTKLGETTIRLSLSSEQDTIDRRRMANAISPNFVHSMDATHLMMSVCYATENGIDSFAMIHDSFGTHAADSNLLAACLREAFVNLYSELDVLDDFRQQILRQVDEADEKKVPSVPAKGDLDLEEVRSSDFFFA